VEAALALFVQMLQRRAELQTVALEDIASRLQALRRLADEAQQPGAAPDGAKVHATLRDLVRVFESLADNAQAFMAGVARSIELQQGGAAAVAVYKQRLIEYLDRFVTDLVRRSDAMASPRSTGMRRRCASGSCARPAGCWRWTATARASSSGRPISPAPCAASTATTAAATCCCASPALVSRWTWDGTARRREPDPDCRFPPS
jgi:hypothetical protein